MYVDLSTPEAEAIASRVHPEGRAPVTRRHSNWDANDIDAWLSGDKIESSEKPWKADGLSVYLALAEHLLARLPQHCFPAVFHLRDGKTWMPDKAIVKTALRDGHIVGTHNVVAPGLLIFRLATSASAIFASGTPIP